MILVIEFRQLLPIKDLHLGITFSMYSSDSKNVIGFNFDWSVIKFILPCRDPCSIKATQRKTHAQFSLASIHLPTILLKINSPMRKKVIWNSTNELIMLHARIWENGAEQLTSGWFFTFLALIMYLFLDWIDLSAWDWEEEESQRGTRKVRSWEVGWSEWSAAGILEVGKTGPREADQGS